MKESHYGTGQPNRHTRWVQFLNWSPPPPRLNPGSTNRIPLMNVPASLPNCQVLWAMTGRMIKSCRLQETSPWWKGLCAPVTPGFTTWGWTCTARKERITSPTGHAFMVWVRQPELMPCLRRPGKLTTPQPKEPPCKWGLDREICW